MGFALELMSRLERVTHKQSDLVTLPQQGFTQELSDEARASGNKQALRCFAEIKCRNVKGAPAQRGAGRSITQTGDHHSHREYAEHHALPPVVYESKA